MKRILITTAMAVVVAAAGVSAVIAAPAPTTGGAPERVGNFQLTDTTRLAHELYYFKYAPAIVLMSQTNGGKVSREGAAQMAKLQAAYKDQGVLFYMINSTPGQSREAAAAEAKSQKFAVPVLMDELQLVGEELGVKREGEVFVIEPKTGFKVAYHGPVTQTAKAIDAVLAGKPVATPRVEVKGGKEIAFPERGRAAEHAAISYSNDVAPIFQAKCVACHQEGGIAPFKFDSYEIVKSFAPMIMESVMSERMPPYFADPHIGTFQNDHGLTAEQNKTLIHWVRAGAPRGTGADVLRKTPARRRNGPPDSASPMSS